MEVSGCWFELRQVRGFSGMNPAFCLFPLPLGSGFYTTGSSGCCGTVGLTLPWPRRSPALSCSGSGHCQEGSSVHGLKNDWQQKEKEPKRSFRSSWCIQTSPLVLWHKGAFLHALFFPLCPCTSFEHSPCLGLARSTCDLPGAACRDELTESNYPSPPSVKINIQLALGKFVQ